MRLGLNRQLTVVAALVACAACIDTSKTDSKTDGGMDAAPVRDATATETPPPDGGTPAPVSYTFKSRFSPTSSSVVYSGQIFRHVLISDLQAHIGGLTERIDKGTFVPTTGKVVAELNFYYLFDGATSGTVIHGISTMPPATQKAYADIAGGASLQGKIAGNDPIGQHRDWSKAFVGWQATGVTTPDSLVAHWFAQIENLAVGRATGTIPKDPSRKPINKVFVTQDGQDYQHLVQKLLLGAIAFSQGTDKYLDDDVAGQGLLADNTKPDKGTSPYTALEHAWDEGFGYFGAARDYGNYTDEELAAKGYHDSNGNGSIDLLSEFNFGHSVNAAKRDLGSHASAKTDFTAEAWGAFLKGRSLITATAGALDAAQILDLKVQRNIAVRAWDNAVAATIVHYINEVLRDMGKFKEESGPAGYDFLAHAKHWSELKGFALSLQFNPRSQLSNDLFARLHDKLGQAPVLPSRSDADISAYKTGLLAARDSLQQAYKFAAANMGDANGAGGW
jgi:hypothetical protein